MKGSEYMYSTTKKMTKNSRKWKIQEIRELIIQNNIIHKTLEIQENEKYKWREKWL